MKLLAAVMLAAALALAAPVAAQTDDTQPQGWKALLIAGDDEEFAFDNAVSAMADKLASFGVPRENIVVLRAIAPDEEASNRENIEAGFASLAADSDEGCFFFATSHGMRGQGLLMRRAQAVLSPRALGHLLDRFCGARPTVVIASGCYSGIFAEGSVPAANRTILTAARDDRSSFGCNARLQYTVFDHCVLDSLERGVVWKTVMDRTRACVSGNEWDLRVRDPSEPQLSIGADVVGLRVFAP
jgi:hypothetical protein